MTVDYIIPCICCEHPPSVSDSVYYGMPILKVANSITAHKQFWAYQCPNCGRGSCKEFESSYLALKDWNVLQRSLYNKESLHEYEQKFLSLGKSRQDASDCECYGEQLSFFK